MAKILELYSMDLLLNLLTKSLIYIVFLMALNSLILGKTGFWAIGNIIYMSIGCYTTGFVSTYFNDEAYMWLPFVIAPVICILLSLAFFYASKLFKKDFFLFFSLFFIELNYVLNKMLAGSSGYSNIIRPSFLNSDLSLFIVVLALFVLVLVYVVYLDKSRKSKTYTIIRTNELLAESWGININKSYLPLFIQSAIISGLAGVLFALCTYGSDPSAFTTNNIIILFTLIIFGGIDSAKGSVSAGLIYVLLVYILQIIFFEASLTSAPKISQIIFGILLIVAPIAFPKGLFGKRTFE